MGALMLWFAKWREHDFSQKLTIFTWMQRINCSSQGTGADVQNFMNISLVEGQVYLDIW